MVLDDIRTYLLTQSPITALVGTDSAGSAARIAAMDRRQGSTADFIVMRTFSIQHAHCINKGAGYADHFIEFDCISTTFAGAKALAEALRGELQGYAGTMGSTTVFAVTSEGDDDEFDDAADGSAKGTYHTISNWKFKVQESVPTF